MSADKAARALERSRAIRRGNHGVVTNLVREAEEIIKVTESFDSLKRNRLHVINQQLEGKLCLLKGMDKDILNCCELEAIETEIEESEAIVAKVIDCRQKIELFVASTPTGGGFPPSTVSSVSLPPPTTSHDPPPVPLSLYLHQNLDFSNLYCLSSRVMSRTGPCLGLI